MNRRQKILAILITLGFANALYVNYLYFFRLPFVEPGQTQLCDINARYSCTDALASDATKIFGIPGCTYALFVYPMLAVLLYLTTVSIAPWAYIAVIGWMGVGMNAYILMKEYQADVYCLLCIICGLIILAIAGMATYQWHTNRMISLPKTGE